MRANWLAVAVVAAIPVLMALPARRARTAEERGLAWLRSQQRPDGSWGSSVYGTMKGGHALTGFLAYVTGDARALEWVSRHLSPDGSLGTADDVQDYPNYATAFALRAFARHRPNDPAVARMIEYFRRGQFAEPRWGPERPEHGGWAYSGASAGMSEVRYLNVSITSWVAEALAEAGVSQEDTMMARARTFVERCRVASGGWQFTPLEDPLNKAGQGVGYGTAAADVACAMRALGADDGGAVEWVAARFGVEAVPGLSGEFAAGLRHYWLARAAALLPSRRAEIRRALEASQRPEGCWRNDEPRMREDDPLIATGLALLALRK